MLFAEDRPATAEECVGEGLTDDACFISTTTGRDEVLTCNLGRSPTTGMLPMDVDARGITSTGFSSDGKSEAARESTS